MERSSKHNKFPTLLDRDLCFGFFLIRYLSFLPMLQMSTTFVSVLVTTHRTVCLGKFCHLPHHLSQKLMLQHAKQRISGKVYRALFSSNYTSNSTISCCQVDLFFPQVEGIVLCISCRVSGMCESRETAWCRREHPQCPGCFQWLNSQIDHAEMSQDKIW